MHIDRARELEEAKDMACQEKYACDDELDKQEEQRGFCAVQDPFVTRGG